MKIINNGSKDLQLLRNFLNSLDIEHSITHSYITIGDDPVDFTANRALIALLARREVKALDKALNDALESHICLTGDKAEMAEYRHNLCKVM